MRHQHRLDDLVVGAFLFDDGVQARGERPDQSIGQEDAQEGADQGAADHAAQHLGRFGDRAHRLDDAQHRRDDAQRRQAVGQGLQRVGRGQGLVVVLLQLLFHGVLDLVRIFEVHGHHPQGVADEVGGEVVLQHLGILLEDGALGRLFDVAFQGDHALGLHRLGQLEQQAQQVLVVLLLPLRPGEAFAQPAQGGLDHRQAVGNQEGRDPRPEDRHQLIGQRIEDGRHLAAVQQEAAEHHGEQHDDADDLEHGASGRPAAEGSDALSPLMLKGAFRESRFGTKRRGPSPSPSWGGWSRSDRVGRTW